MWRRWGGGGGARAGQLNGHIDDPDGRERRGGAGRRRAAEPYSYAARRGRLGRLVAGLGPLALA